MARLKDDQIVAVHEMHEPVRVGDAARPGPLGAVRELLRFPDACEGIVKTRLDQGADAREDASISGQRA
ncbi:hypothetical protein GCM10027408_12530 [Microbacterium tumbae]